MSDREVFLTNTTLTFSSTRFQEKRLQAVVPSETLFGFLSGHILQAYGNTRSNGQRKLRSEEAGLMCHGQPR